ncbi:hypothetical protein NQ315_010399 [Exocentrus adspersus]|uniref:Uncharacterized protein n=1 Tax=Exocentrus adspersus TaxID=1586481 RepID=A0AAV8WBW3_9CUCU|nr:hypothetical protein NQ315_010399 [Exocentrus adspersus]
MDNKDNEKKKADPPGWNDPPMLHYSSSNPPPKSRITNKRIPFPLTICSSPSTSTAPLPAALASPPPPQPPLSPPRRPTQKMFTQTKDNLGKFILTHKSQKTKECIHLLYKYWEEKRFSYECMEEIYLMSQYLAEKDTASAEEVKERLLTRFKDYCEDWLVDFVI